MTSQNTIDNLAHIENVMRPLHDDTLVDPVITIARQALAGGSGEAEIEEELTEEKSLHNAVERAEQMLNHWKAVGDLRKTSAAHWALGVAHLALKHAEKALEHLHISAEMAEANKDRVTHAWALAYHGLTKIAMFDKLRNEGKEEVEEAKGLLEEEDNMLGVCAINERTRSMMY